MDEDAVGSGFQDSPDPSNSESQSVVSEASTSGEDNEPLSPSEEDGSNAGEWPPFPPTKDAPKDANHENDISNTIRRRRDEDKRKGGAVSKQLVSPLRRDLPPVLIPVVRVFGIVCSTPEYVCRNLSRRLTVSLW